MSSGPLRVRYSLIAGVVLCAGCLDLQSKDDCITSADCLSPNSCVSGLCVKVADAGTELDGAVAPDAQYVVAEFDQQDTRFFTADGDWAPGEIMAECPSNMFVNGISTTSANRGPEIVAHSALCQESAMPIYHSSAYSHGTPGGPDDRGDTQTGNWDPGYSLFECAQSEVVTGIAQSPSLALGTILCTGSATVLDPSNCAALYIYSSMDNRIDSNSGDWAYLYIKSECGTMLVLKGISTDPATGELHRILCCPPLPAQ